MKDNTHYLIVPSHDGTTDAQVFMVMPVSKDTKIQRKW